MSDTTSPIERIRLQAEKRKAALEGVEISTTSNLTITADALNHFTGSVPDYDWDSPSDVPLSIEGGIPCALRVGRIVVTEMRAFMQPEGGFQAGQDRVNTSGNETDWNYMNQIEATIALPGARIGYMDGEEFISHPMYEDESMIFVTSRALEAYIKSPFRVTPEVVEGLREAVLARGFVPADLGDNPARVSKRQDLWHLQALAVGGNKRDKIIARQQSGLPLESFTLTAPRELSNRPTDSDGQAIPEFEDFMRHIEENLHRVTVGLATGENISEAGSLSTAITGVNAPYPLRATTASLTWISEIQGETQTFQEKHPVNFFPDISASDEAPEEVKTGDAPF